MLPSQVASPFFVFQVNLTMSRGNLVVGLRFAQRQPTLSK